MAVARIGYVVLLLLLAGACQPPPHAGMAPPAVSPSPSSPSTVDAGEVETEPAQPAPDSLSPPDAVEAETEPATDSGWCLDTNPEHCESGFGRCMDTCYRFNHPNGPAHDACDNRCRDTYCPAVRCDSL